MESLSCEIPEPEVWHKSCVGSSRFGFLSDGRKVVELPAVGAVPAYRFVEAVR